MQPGDILVARYAIERRAGSGGMATVYQATDLHEQRAVALKRIHSPERRAVDRFAREVRILSSLRHPGIVRHLAHGTTDDGDSYLVMEWLEGEDLKRSLGRGLLSVDETLRVGHRIADALAAAHAHGVVHRDVKPANIFLPDGDVDRAKLLDFGVAKLMPAADAISAIGTAIGTAGYMAPEQVRAHAELDARADVFSLGCVLFACLTGRAPFVAQDRQALLVKALLEDAPRVTELRAGVPEPIAELIARMLAKDREDRPADGAVVAAELASLQRGDVATAPRRVIPAALTDVERRLLCVILVGGGTTTDRDPPHTPVPIPPTGETVDARRSSETPAPRLAVHGARVEALADGSLVAILSGGGVVTDRAASAARCAVRLCAERPGAPIAMATGWGVVAGGLPVGEVTDRAAELLRRDAASGRIRLDELSAGLLDRRFVVRGDAAGLYLEGERRASEPPRTLLGERTPFVGREGELGALSSLFDACVVGGAPSVALVTGAAGAGKSRLCDELVARVIDRGAALQVWSARGDAVAAGTPLRMLALALRDTAGVLDDDPPEVQRWKLQARVVRNVAAGERERIAWFLGELAGVPFVDDTPQGRAARRDALLMSDQLTSAWIDFLDAEAAAQPVLLVLEDLQWGDAPSVRFVDAALRRVTDRPWMVLSVARPEVHTAFPRLWSDHGVHETRLGELPRRAAERLVAEVLGARADAATTARVVEQAAGSAFFLEELIRAVAAGRGDALPPTVIAMVEGRIEVLPAGARRVLRAASVFGRTFWRGGIAALLGDAGDGISLDEWITDLVDAELIARSAEPRFAGEDAYVFRHDLVREAAHATLTDGDRALGHRLAGPWLEGAGETNAHVLAEHAEAGGDRERALRWLVVAAEQALELNDLAAAIAHAARALSLAPTRPVRGRLRAVMAEAYRWRGHNLGAARSSLAALRHLAPGDAAWYRAIGIAALACGRLGQVERLGWLADWLRRVEIPAGAGDAAVVASALLVEELLHAGEYGAADDLLARIAPAADGAEREPLVAARVHEASTVQALFRGEIETCLRHCQAAIDRFEEAGDLRSACTRRVSVAYLSLEVGAYEGGELLLRETLATAERMGLENVAAIARQNLGLALARLGRFDEARVHEEAAIAALAAQGHRRMEGLSRQYHAIILLLAGDLVGAEHEIARALELSTASPPGHAYALATQAQILLATGRAVEARVAAEAARRVLDLLERVEEGEALVRLVDAETLDAIGDREGAARAITAAAARLHTRAATFADPPLRASFLHRVPENARTLALAVAWAAGE